MKAYFDTERVAMCDATHSIPYTINDNTDTLSQHIVLVSLPVVVTGTLWLLMVISKPPSFNWCSREDLAARTILSTVVFVNSAVALVLLWESIERIDSCSSDSTSLNSSQTTHDAPVLTALTVVRVPLMVGLTIIMLLNLMYACMRHYVVIMLLNVIAMVGLVVMIAFLYEPCPNCTWPLFPLILNIGSVTLTCLAMYSSILLVPMTDRRCIQQSIRSSPSLFLSNPFASTSDVVVAQPWNPTSLRTPNAAVSLSRRY